MMEHRKVHKKVNSKVACWAERMAAARVDNSAVPWVVKLVVLMVSWSVEYLVEHLDNSMVAKSVGLTDKQ